MSLDIKSNNKSLVTSEGPASDLVAVLGGDPEAIGRKVAADKLEVAARHTNNDICRWKNSFYRWLPKPVE